MLFLVEEEEESSWYSESDDKESFLVCKYMLMSICYIIFLFYINIVTNATEIIKLKMILTIVAP